MSTLENVDLQLQFHLAVCISYFAFGIWHLALCILHFAFCILHNFAGGKNRLFQTHSQSRCAIVLCCVGLQIELRVHLQHSIYICNRRWQKPRRLPLAALLNFILDILLSKETHHACSFCKVFASGHLQDAKLSSSVLAHCWLSNLFCKLTNKFKALMDSTP